MDARIAGWVIPIATAALLWSSADLLAAQPEGVDTTPPLAGPSVDQKYSQSLARSDMQGRFIKLDVRPEEAALRVMVLDPETRERAQGVIADRAARLRRHLVDQIDLIKTSNDETIAGDANAKQRLAKQLYETFEPGHLRDPLAGPLAAVLTPEKHAEMMRLVDDYWEAWIDAEVKASPKTKREAMEERLSFRQFQIELGAAYESTLRPFQQKLDAICEVVEATPEQRQRIRTAVIRYIRDASLNPTDAQRQELAEAVYSALEESQRVKLFAAALSRL